MRGEQPGTEKPVTNLSTGEGVHRGALANLLQELGRVPVTRRMREALPKDTLRALGSAPAFAIESPSETDPVSPTGHLRVIQPLEY